MSSLAVRRGPGPLLLARRAIRHHSALQRTWELASLIALIRARGRLRTVIEIGTHRGGTLYCWAALAESSAQFVIIDIPDKAEGMGFRGSDAARFAHALRPTQRLTWVRHASQTDAADVEVRRALGDRRADLLWIDGDHAYESVKRDFELYAPRVRPGGLIAFHDVRYNPEYPETRVDLLWTSIAPCYRHWSYVEQDQPGGVGMGIGVIEWPGN